MQHEGRADVINSHQHVSDPYNPPPAETKALSTGSGKEFPGQSKAQGKVT